MGKYFLFIWFTAFLLVACGNPFRDEQARNRGYTRIVTAPARALQDFQLDRWLASANSASDGWDMFLVPTYEAMIYAFETAVPGHRGAMRVAGASQTPDANHNPWWIPNGTYNFFTVGYSAADLAGNPICSLGRELSTGTPGDPLVLSGGSKVIEFTGISNCGSGAPWRTGTYSGFQLAFCNNSDISSKIFSDTCTGTVSSFQSAKIVFVQENNFYGDSGTMGGSIPSGSMTSACLTVSGTTGLIPTALNLTGGDSGTLTQARIVTHVAVYTDAACATLYGGYEFPDGLSATGSVKYATVGSAWTADSTKAKWDGTTAPRLFLRQF